jgi:uncharacterized protein YkwD
LTIVIQHQDLFVDSDIAGRGHRLNILDDRYQQIGVGQVVGNTRARPSRWSPRTSAFQPPAGSF